MANQEDSAKTGNVNDHPDRSMPDQKPFDAEWQAWVDKYHAEFRPKGTTGLDRMNDRNVKRN